MNSSIEFHDTYIIKKCIYIITSTNPKKVIYDQNRKFKKELENTIKIQELDISPKLLEFDSINHILIMERIIGLTLEQIALDLKDQDLFVLDDFLERYINPCIPLFEKLLSKLDSWDPSLANIIYDGNQFYLIDFSELYSSKKKMTVNDILISLDNQLERIKESHH